MKALFSILLLGLAVLPASAATVTFGFESRDFTPVSSGSGYTTTNLSEAGDLATNAVFGGFTGTLAPTATTIVRAYRPTNMANSETPDINTHVSYLTFTITPDAGQMLDLSTATLSFNLGSFTGFSANQDMKAFARAGYSVNGGTYTALGSVVSAIAPPYADAADNWTGQSSFNSTANKFKIVQTSSGALSLSGITGLAAGDSVTFRIALGDTSSSNASLTGTSQIKGIYVDQISVDGFSVIPEPSAMALVAMGGLAFSLRRRR